VSLYVPVQGSTTSSPTGCCTRGSLGYDKHFLAVAEDEGSYAYVNEHWPGHAVRVHVDNIEQGQSSETLETAGLKSTTEKSTKGGASAMDTPEFLLIM